MFHLPRGSARIPVLVLSWALTLPWSALAEPRAGARALRDGAAEEGMERTVAPGFFSTLWSYLSSAWGKEGCILDPNGCAVHPTGPGGSGLTAPESCDAGPGGSCGPSQGAMDRPDAD